MATYRTESLIIRKLMMGVRMKIEPENLKGLKERADYLPKRELQWARWGENILAG